MSSIVGTDDIFKKISSQIETQFPGFVREEGPQFVAFLKAYFEYMEQNGNAVNAIRSLRDNQDIDRTVDSFVEYFRKEFMINIPKDVLADKRLLNKHIRDFYRTRGSQESYRFLFRALFNQEIDFYYPGDDILRASDGRWIQETRLRVGSPSNINPRTFEGKRIRGITSGAVAFVEEIIATEALGILVYDMTVRDVVGTFVDGERVVNQDNTNQFSTVNSQTGPLVDITIRDGGAFHELNDQVEIGGAGATDTATALVSELSNKSAVTVKIVKAGSGYTKENTRIIVGGGNGTGFQAKIQSFTQQSILGGLAINTDLIGPMKNVRLDSPSFFVRPSANTSTIPTKLSGTVSTSSVSNTITGTGTNFTTQLQVGDIVRIYGVANTARVHSITNATSFISAFTPFQTVSGANAYIKLAGANVSTRLVTALTFSNAAFYSINAITLINPGYGYNLSLPTIQIVDDFMKNLAIPDGNGRIYGNNAVIIANNAPGAISKVRLQTRGANFNKYDEATVLNTTQTNTAFTETQSSSFANGSPSSRYVIRKKTFSGTGNAKTSGLIIFPGRYIDTKGFLSWNNRLQDNDYYQEFSYVIRVNKMLSKYRDVIKALVHPAGTKLFGDYVISSTVNVNITAIDEAPNIVRRRISEPVTAIATHTATASYTGGINVTEAISAAATHTATFLANTAITEAITSIDTSDSTFIANTFRVETITSADTPNATFIANTFAVESVTSITAENAVYTANTRRTELIAADTAQNATFLANTSITEIATANDTPNATFIANTFAVESITSTDTPNATFIANTFAVESISLVVSENGTYIANTSRSESVSSIVSENATFIANASITESVTAAVAHQGQRFAYMSGVYGKVLYANSQIQAWATAQIQPYAAIAVGAFDGTPRLVIGTAGPYAFANGALFANTGSINVGGIGSNLYIVPVGSSNTDIFNVNTIFSNSAFTIRQNYIPTSANVEFYYSTGP